MTKSFLQAWHYRISYADNLFSVYLNDRLVGNIQKPLSGRWPVYAIINDRLYSFSKKKSLCTSIIVVDEISKDHIGIIKLPFLSPLLPSVKFAFATGEKFVWQADIFFSLHWKWMLENENVMEAIDNLAQQRNSGVIAIPEYKQGTDLLIITGFFLSLLRRSKLSMGLWGLKRNIMRFSKDH
ncbi:MAG: hypothetical protein IPP72_00535 [Chitinophagaceae bacterium]|nr:hypothetical protein [Chitinophagaceae bacterium]